MALTGQRALAENIAATNPGTAAPARMPRTAGKGANTPRHKALVAIATRHRVGARGGAAKVMPGATAALGKNLPAPAADTNRAASAGGARTASGRGTNDHDADD